MYCCKEPREVFKRTVVGLTMMANDELNENKVGVEEVQKKESLTRIYINFVLPRPWSSATRFLRALVPKIPTFLFIAHHRSVTTFCT